MRVTVCKGGVEGPGGVGSWGGGGRSVRVQCCVG